MPAGSLPKEVVPVEPPLPGEDEVERDRQRIIKIGDGHRDPGKVPPHFWDTHDLKHLERPMEGRGTEDPATRQGDMGMLKDKVLFIDDYPIEDASGLVRRLVPGKKEGVVYEVDAPPFFLRTENEQLLSEGASFYGNVIHNGSHFRMFHRLNYDVALAVSKDGLRWTHETDLKSITTSRNMWNQDFGGELCVQHDPNPAKPEEAYFAGAKCKGGEFCVLKSQDGVEWKYAGHPYGRAADTYPCLYKDGEEKYTAIIRQEFSDSVQWRAIRGVQVLEAKSKTVTNLENLEPVTDWYLDLYGKDEWRRRSLYALTRTKYSGMYLGLAQVYEFPYGTDHERPFDTDVMQPYLVTSHDGRKFDLSWIRRTPLVPRGGPDDFDHGIILTAADWLTHGGHHWLYYSGWNAQHETKNKVQAKIGLMRWKQDRLVELVPKAGGEARLRTRPFQLPADPVGLEVDAACGSRGRVSVTVLLVADVPVAEEDRKLAVGSLGGFDSGSAEIPLEFVAKWGWSWGRLSEQHAQLEFRLDGQVSLFGFRFRTRTV